MENKAATETIEAVMKLLVTGGAGFIGSHLCDELVARGSDVVVLDNLSLGKLSNISHILASPKFKFYKGDILDENILDELFKEHLFDCVFHMAANSDIAKSHSAPSIDFNNTFLTTFRILDMMRKYGTTQIVFASTSAIYGEAAGKIREDHGPLQPISHYGASKLASEAFIYSYGENYGIQSWITRFPNVVGPRATHGAVYDFVHKLRATPNQLTVLGDGTQEKPYLNVNDLVNAILLVWEKSDQKYNVFNVGCETTTKVSDIARIVAEQSHEHVDIHYTGGSRGWVGDVPRFAYDTSAIEALGWKASMTSDEAVRIAAEAIWSETK